MEFNQEEKIALKRLCQSIIEDPLPIEFQESVRRDGYLWCADWWTIEVLKFLFNGEGIYRQDPPPRRLKSNPIFSREDICIDGNNKIKMFNHLNVNSEFSDVLVVCEVGRGIDLVLAGMIKNWREIIVYDNNSYVIEKIKRYFVDRLHWPIKTYYLPSKNFDLPKERPLIVLANNTKGAQDTDWFKKEDNECLIIYNGDVIHAGNRAASGVS